MHFADTMYLEHSTHMYLEHFLFFQVVTVGVGSFLEFYQQKLNTKLMDISVLVILDVPKHLIQKCLTKMSYKNVIKNVYRIF